MKNRFDGTTATCADVLTTQLPNFLQHTLIKRHQSQFFKHEIESVKSKSQKVVIQVDFAENYATKNQNEVQSAYWSYNQVTLYTVCLWEQNGTHSLGIASNYLSHDKYAVHCFLRKIFEHLMTIGDFREVVFSSDGAASHFKQKYIFANLTYQDKNISWNFFATSHGKGAVDGIGGQLKRLVKKQAMSGSITVDNSLDFVNAAAKNSNKTVVIHASKEEIESSIDYLDCSWEGIKSIPQTQTIHQIKVIDNGVVVTRKHSNIGDGTIHHFHPKNKEVSTNQSMR